MLNWTTTIIIGFWLLFVLIFLTFNVSLFRSHSLSCLFFLKCAFSLSLDCFPAPPS
ncbi:uncharacterized protein ASCRUDRAFT_115802 [Ascoidea rubescens DSM 1968]|uniref:Uncharacterized protein n=1 Tax=Ascoidea rubescens DSM 1968 TaxID=1344418 RepID=A0A1D2VBW8_9ASCO|nr:hypothetical protein ASCRUDRAFT_115802 [Ascoidea rubescens DSM 1968]ODV59052.1 hypothetical protein ASCRUDRAFT_115802 [Ascoidea rubescens DSM 1968]